MKPTEQMRIENAYKVLDLPLGASYAEARKQYKFMAFTYHTDRSTNTAFVEKYETKMRELNDANEVINAHFANDGTHKADGSCICQPQAQTPETDSEVKPKRARRKKTESADRGVADDAEAKARARTSERARRRGKTAPPAAEDGENNPVPAQEEEPDEATLERLRLDWQAEDKRDQEMVRWKVAAVCFAIMGCTYLISLVGLAFSS